MTLRRDTWHALPALRLEGQAGALTVVPERGAKITSLRGPDGHEWLAQRQAGAPGSSFVDAEMCGWDECAPTIDACSVGPWTYADHGNLWDQPWTVDQGSKGITTSITDPHVPYRLTRTITDTPTGFHLAYTATSTADEPIPLLWAAHPQFTTHHGSQVVVDGAVWLRDVFSDRQLRETIPMAPDGSCAKYWAPARSGLEHATLRHGHGRGLTLAWSAAEVPGLAIWVDGAVYAPEPVIAIEPATGNGDCATDPGTRILAPRGSCSWQLWLHLED